MTYFLIIYDRHRGDLISINEYGDSREALAARFAREREFNDSDRIEVAVLAAASVDELKRTHARYFKSAAGLVTKMQQEDRAASATTSKRRVAKRIAHGTAGR